MTFIPLKHSVFAIIATLLVTLAGCVYKVNVQQGNLLSEQDVDQVQVGWTRSQVRFLLGTPLVNNPFDDNQWEYYYYFKVGKTGESVSRRFTIFFEGDAVESVEKPDAALNESDDAALRQPGPAHRLAFGGEASSNFSRIGF